MISRALFFWLLSSVPKSSISSSVVASQNGSSSMSSQCEKKYWGLETPRARPCIAFAKPKDSCTGSFDSMTHWVVPRRYSSTIFPPRCSIRPYNLRKPSAVHTQKGEREREEKKKTPPHHFFNFILFFFQFFFRALSFALSLSLYDNEFVFILPVV